MGAIASQITSLTIVYSTVHSDADQRKHQSSASLAIVRGIHWGPVNSPHKCPVTQKMLPFDDVIMRWSIWCRLPFLKWNIKTWWYIFILNTCADTFLQIHTACSDIDFMIWWVPWQMNTWTKALHLIWAVFIGICHREANMILWDVITPPCPWYLLLLHRPSYQSLSRTVNKPVCNEKFISCDLFSNVF